MIWTHQLLTIYTVNNVITIRENACTSKCSTFHSEQYHQNYQRNHYVAFYPVGVTIIRIQDNNQSKSEWIEGEKLNTDRHLIKGK